VHSRKVGKIKQPEQGQPVFEWQASADKGAAPTHCVNKAFIAEPLHDPSHRALADPECLGKPHARHQRLIRGRIYNVLAQPLIQLVPDQGIPEQNALGNSLFYLIEF